MQQTASTGGAAGSGGTGRGIRFGGSPADSKAAQGFFHLGTSALGAFQLFSRGYVQRSDCAADRRCKYVRLTEQGKRVQRQVQALHEECESRILWGYSKARLAGLKKELKDLAAAISSDHRT
ncbi:MAG: hypothetical protein WBB73_15435 [Candidatus Aminicenantaceae bacterium]